MWIDILLTLLIAAALFFSLRKIVLDRRRGKGCSCGCGGCLSQSSCHSDRKGGA